MIPLYRDSHFTFRFGDDRIVSLFHLEWPARDSKVTPCSFTRPSSTSQGKVATKNNLGNGNNVILPLAG